MIDPRDIPGHRPDNDREQLAALGDSATIRPDSATPATVKESVTVRPGGGWRGHLPLCRGPGGTMARRLRTLMRGRR